MSVVTQNDWYKTTFANWQAKHYGPKPSLADIETAHVFGRPGKQSLALAMCMRAEGATAPQILMVCGAPQNNHRTALIEGKLFKREPHAPDANNHTVYKVSLTAKGAERVAKHKAKAEADAAAGAVTGEAKAAKGDKPKAAKKAPSKPRKAAKAEPANLPVTTEPTVNAAGDVINQPQA